MKKRNKERSFPTSSFLNFLVKIREVPKDFSRMNFWGILIGLIFIILGIGAIFGVNVWKYFFPLLLILFGLSLLLNQSRRHPSSWNPSMNPTVTHENTLNYSLSFSGANIKVESTDFQGGKVSTFFAGANIDLRDAKIKDSKTVTLEISAVFGGVKVIVPKSWKVEGNMSGVFGGFTNTTVAPDKPQGTLVIKGSAVFGGGEITN